MLLVIVMMWFILTHENITFVVCERSTFDWFNRAFMLRKRTLGFLISVGILGALILRWFFATSSSSFRSTCDVKLSSSRVSVAIATDRLTSFDVSNPDFTQTPIAESRPTITFLYNRKKLSQDYSCVHVVLPIVKGHTIASIADCVKSIQQQSFQSFQLVIPTEHLLNQATLDFLNEIAVTDDRVLILPQSAPLSFGALRNVGFRASNSDFVYVLDAINMIEPTALEKSFLFSLNWPAAGLVQGFSACTNHCL
jgi:hypothetical protein